MGLFSSIGKAISSVGKTVGKVVGNVAKTVAPVASLIPGVGSVVGAAAGIVGELLSPTKQESIVEAVAEQGVVKLDKIEETLLTSNPNIDAGTLQVATKQMADVAIAANPTATVDDSKSLTDVSFLTKAWQWIKSNFIIVAVGVAGVFLLLFNKGGRRRRW
jgi:hypothetical protein